LKECEEAEEAYMEAGTEEESDGDYEEADDFDPEFSIFGSERVIEKNESILGKRSRV